MKKRNEKEREKNSKSNIKMEKLIKLRFLVLGLCFLTFSAADSKGKITLEEKLKNDSDLSQVNYFDKN